MLAINPESLQLSKPKNTRLEVSEFTYLQPRMVQRIVIPNQDLRMEGVAFREDGNVMGTALSDGNAVLLYRKDENGEAFEELPFCRLVLNTDSLNYPHDLAFSLNDAGRYLAVALRSGGLAIYERADDGLNYHTEPIQVLDTRTSKLQYTDGVCFLPPSGEVMAVCNTATDELILFRKNTDDKAYSFGEWPIQAVWGDSIYHPDGIASTACGKYVAIANHHANNVAIFAVDPETTKLVREPIKVITDSSLKYPHSVQFTPKHNHLLVTCAGVNYINVYRAEQSETGSALQWSEIADQHLYLGFDELFAEVNAENDQEGGPKGLSLSRDLMAVCRAETGLTLYPYQENQSEIRFPVKSNDSEHRVLRSNPSYVLKGGDEGFCFYSEDSNTVLNVNESAAAIYSLCDGVRSIAEITDILQAQFPDHDRITEDVLDTLYKLILNEIVIN